MFAYAGVCFLVCLVCVGVCVCVSAVVDCLLRRRWRLLFVVPLVGVR